MQAGTLARSSIDRSFYAMLKLHVFATVHHIFLRSFQHGQNGHAVAEAKPTLGRFTARKADHLFVPRNGSALSCSADFYGFTPHKVREKLALLEQRDVVVLEGRGLRDAYTYRWTEPVRLHELSSFMVLHRHTADDLSLNIELARLFAAVGRNPFAVADFLSAYDRAHDEEYGNTRWGARRFERIRHSPAYASFLKARLRKLVERGLVVEAAQERFMLTPAGLELVHHFHLFVDAVPYTASPAMCQACPLFQSCRIEGRVEPILGTLSDHLTAFGGPSPEGKAEARGRNGAAVLPPGTAPARNGHGPSRASSGRVAAKAPPSRGGANDQRRSGNGDRPR